jgi:hypothetical protein
MLGTPAADIAVASVRREQAVSAVAAEYPPESLAAILRPTLAPKAMQFR